MWLHPGQRSTAGACPGLDAAVKQLQALQDELAQLLTLRRRTAEYQVRRLQEIVIVRPGSIRLWLARG